MAWSFWARVIPSAAACLLCAVASADAYGGFGFREIPHVPGFRLTKEGFKVSDAPSDTFKFGAPFKAFRPKAVNAYQALYQGDDFALAPGALRVSVFNPGFELYFPLGFELQLTSSLSPYLTWSEGTVNAGVPAAPAKWLMVSFQDGQPPVLMSFAEPSQFQLTGVSGEWRLRPVGRFKGWVRFTAPFGPNKIFSSVEALGAAVQKITKLEPFVQEPGPVLVSQQTRSDAGGVTQVWTFDKPGAVLPMPVLLSKHGGYPVKVLTGVTEPLVDLVDGPVAFSKEPRIAVFFPMRRIPVGRSLTVGDTGYLPPATVSSLDVPTVVELALANLTCQRDRYVAEAVAAARQEFSQDLKAVKEPATGSQSWIAADGSGVDVAAANALLEQTVVASGGQPTTKNLLLGSLSDRMDMATWLIAGANPDSARRATGLFTFAAALGMEPETRLRAAMAQCGLAAQSMLPTFQARRGFAVKPTSTINPLAALRTSLFVDGAVRSKIEPYLASLLANVRIMTPAATRLEKHADGYLVSWVHEAESPRVLELVTGYPIEVEAKANLAKVVPRSLLGVTTLEIEPAGPGECQILLRLPEYAETLPVAVRPPAYDE